MSHYKIPSFKRLQELENHKSISQFHDYLEYIKTDFGFIVYDVETSLINKDKSIFNQDYTFVMGATHWVPPGGPIENIKIFQTAPDMKEEVTSWVCHVGHNLPFDMNVLDIDADLDTYFYWDTSIAQYLLTNQKMLYPSLQESCEYYGIPLKKEDKVSEMIKSGVDPTDIPKDLLEEYLRNDIDMTRELFLKQIADLNTRSVPFRNLVIQHMVWRTHTYNASRAGIMLDIPRIEASIEKTKKEIKELEDKIILELNRDFTDTINSNLAVSPIPTWNFDFDISPDSPKQLSAYLYGAEITANANTIVGTYKTGPKKGTPKTKIEKIIVRSPSKVNKGSLTTDNTSLQTIINTHNKFLYKSLEMERVVEICENVLKYRVLNKNISTYFEGYSQHADRDGKVHPQFNHTATPTGRLTCNKPNTQNTKGDD